MATSAKVPFLATIHLGNGATAGEVFTKIAEVTEIGWPEETRDTIDGTHFESPGGRREFVAGWGDGGEVTFTCNFIGAGYVAMKAAYDAAKQVTVRISVPSVSATAKLEVPVIPTALGVAVPMDDKMTASMTLKANGASTFTP